MRSKVGVRLLYVVHHGYPDSSDGYAVRTHGVARGLMAHGVEVLVVTEPGDPAGGHLSSPSESTEACVDGVLYWHPAMRGFHEVSYAERHDAFSTILQKKIRHFQPTAVMAASNWQLASAGPQNPKGFESGRRFVSPAIRCCTQPVLTGTKSIRPSGSNTSDRLCIQKS